ncbi:MAG: hypothetical protein J6A89_08970 [Clostridia bacterium]|nr:hypothetical protein [Clostridia bacterium]
MKEKFLKIKNWLLKNKLMLFCFIIIYIIFVYTGLNTFNSNDDLPYSFMYRGEQRISSLGQVLQMQLSDYKMLSSRFVVHFTVQTLLIFGRTLFAILNPIFILALIILATGIIKKFFKNDILEKKLVRSVPFFLLAIFLLMYSHRYIVYWTAGAVNYIWTLVVAVLLYYMYVTTEMNKYYIFNILVFLLASILHESLITFAIVFLISIIILDIIKNKKIDFKKFIYFIPILIGIKVLILAPRKFNKNAVISRVV